MAPKVILIADYHDDSRTVYSAILQYSGFVVLEARDGAEALELVPKHSPDIVNTEIALPVIDGWEVMQRLKADPLTAQIPVLIATADSRPELRQQAMDTDCACFELNPFAPLDLLNAVRRVLDYPNAVIPA